MVIRVSKTLLYRMVLKFVVVPLFPVEVVADPLSHALQLIFIMR